MRRDDPGHQCAPAGGKVGDYDVAFVPKQSTFRMTSLGANPDEVSAIRSRGSEGHTLLLGDDRQDIGFIDAEQTDRWR